MLSNFSILSGKATIIKLRSNRRILSSTEQTALIRWPVKTRCNCPSLTMKSTRLTQQLQVEGILRSPRAMSISSKYIRRLNNISTSICTKDMGGTFSTLEVIMHSMDSLQTFNSPAQIKNTITVSHFNLVKIKKKILQMVATTSMQTFQLLTWMSTCRNFRLEYLPGG